jgi:hypothetical protein
MQAQVSQERVVWCGRQAALQDADGIDLELGEHALLDQSAIDRVDCEGRVLAAVNRQRPEGVAWGGGLQTEEWGSNRWREYSPGPK